MKRAEIADSVWRNWINPFFDEIIMRGEEAKTQIMLLSKYNWEKFPNQEIRISRKSVSIYIENKLESESNDYDSLRETLDCVVVGPWMHKDHFVSERSSELMIKDLESRETAFKNEHSLPVISFWENCQRIIQQRIFKYEKRNLLAESKAHEEVLDFINIQLGHSKPIGDTIQEGSWDKKIFSSERGFKIFLAFKEEVIAKNNEYSAYSFLFRSLLKDEFINDMGHLKFLKFLRDSGYSNIIEKHEQFNRASSEKNKKTYNRCKAQVK